MAMPDLSSSRNRDHVMQECQDLKLVVDFFCVGMNEVQTVVFRWRSKCPKMGHGSGLNECVFICFYRWQSLSRKNARCLDLVSWSCSWDVLYWYVEWNGSFYRHWHFLMMCCAKVPKCPFLQLKLGILTAFELEEIWKKKHCVIIYPPGD